MAFDWGQADDDDLYSSLDWDLVAQQAAKRARVNSASESRHNLPNRQQFATVQASELPASGQQLTGQHQAEPACVVTEATPEGQHAGSFQLQPALSQLQEFWQPAPAPSDFAPPGQSGETSHASLPDTSAMAPGNAWPKHPQFNTFNHAPGPATNHGSTLHRIDSAHRSGQAPTPGLPSSPPAPGLLMSDPAASATLGQVEQPYAHLFAREVIKPYGQDDNGSAHGPSSLNGLACHHQESDAGEPDLATASCQVKSGSSCAVPQVSAAALSAAGVSHQAPTTANQMPTPLATGVWSASKRSRAPQQLPEQASTTHTDLPGSSAPAPAHVDEFLRIQHVVRNAPANSQLPGGAAAGLPQHYAHASRPAVLQWPKSGHTQQQQIHQDSACNGSVDMLHQDNFAFIHRQQPHPNWAANGSSDVGMRQQQQHSASSTHTLQPRANGASSGDINCAAPGQSVPAGAQRHSMPDAQVTSGGIVLRQAACFAHACKQHKLAQPEPPFERCPGVYRQGQGEVCGGLLEWAACEQGYGIWRCTQQDTCSWWEWAAPRLPHPWLTLEISGPATFKVAAAPGATAAVEACGGVLALLQAAGLDAGLWTRPFQTNTPSDEQSAADTSTAEATPAGVLEMDLEQYEVVRQALLNKRQHGLELADTSRPNAFIPAPTLAAFRKPQGQSTQAEEAQKRLAVIPGPLASALLPFQLDGVKWGIAHSGRVLIADEMGVGKTVQAIALASAYKEEWPLLIIAPASLRLVWAEELERWLPHLRPSQIHVIENRTDRLDLSKQLPQVVITSYEMLQRLTCDACRIGPPMQNTPTCPGKQGCMAQFGWRVVIADESHTLRTSNRAPDARHTEAVASVVKRATRAIFLSGTPSLSRPFDLFRQVDALRPGLLGTSREVFAQRYCARRLAPVWQKGRRTDHRKWDNSGLARATELHLLLKQEVMLRRLKVEVMAQLPPKRRQVVRLPPPKQADWPPSEMSVQDVEGEEVPEGEAGEQEGKVDEQQKLRELSSDHRTGLAKLPNVIEWLINKLGHGHDNGSSRAAQDMSAARGCSHDQSQAAAGSRPARPRTKLLVFAHHRGVMNKLAAALEGQGGGADWQGIPYVRIDGASDSRDRRAAVAQFRDDPAIAVALLSVTAAGIGLDFSTASAVVFAELPQEIAFVRQAEDRAHRHGQRMPVNVYFLVSRGTSDDKRWRALNRSLERVTAVHDAAQGTDAGGILIDRVCEASDRAVATQMVPLTLSKTPQPPGNTTSSTNDTGTPGSPPASPGCRAESLNLDESSAAHVTEQSAHGRDEPSDDSDADLLSPGMVRMAGMRTPRTRAAAAKRAVQDSLTLMEMQDKVWFEVSQNTGRVHMHHAVDGSAMLGLSLPMELLLMEDGPCATLANIYHALDCRKAGGSAHVGPAGVLAVAPGTTSRQLRAIVAAAREFAAEWTELRSIFQSKLFGHVLRPPLQSHVEELESKANAAGAYGSSLDRFTDAWQGSICAPAGSDVHTVTVLYPRIGKSSLYKQAFRSSKERLCITCGSAVSCSLPAETVLEGAMHLFCGVECETNFCIRANSGAMRRALFKLERGVCQTCRLNCHALVGRIRTIEKGTDDWEARRRALLLLLAPTFGQHGAKAYLDRLVKYAVEGNAWHADHIMPVHKGGGLCGLENLRTLCVLCHMEVTRRQARQRAAARKAAKKAAAEGSSHPTTQTSITAYMSQPSTRAPFSNFSKVARQGISTAAASDEPGSLEETPGSPSSVICQPQASISSHGTPSCSLASRDGTITDADAEMRLPADSAQGSERDFQSGGGHQHDPAEVASSPRPILLGQANPMVSPLPPDLQMFACAPAAPDLPPASPDLQLSQQAPAPNDSSSIPGMNLTGNDPHAKPQSPQHSRAAQRRLATRAQQVLVGPAQSLFPGSSNASSEGGFSSSTREIVPARNPLDDQLLAMMAANQTRHSQSGHNSCQPRQHKRLLLVAMQLSCSIICSKIKAALQMQFQWRSLRSKTRKPQAWSSNFRAWRRRACGLKNWAI
ncbi:hypothetical protein WJX74_008894 [Apatococcus lobatus]|uniref:Uncharacterized protein n=1 Tax=Apatococcus lobatus TaxID=904363 RepID=A0AAW1SHC9_9CHLO